MVGQFIEQSLKDSNDYYIAKKHVCSFNDYNALMIGGNKLNISIVEKYNACPKAAFLAYGLKLQKQKRDKIEYYVIGLFIHEVAEIFVRDNIKCLGFLEEKNIEDGVKKIIEKILLKEEYYSLKLKENQFILKMLCLECERFCKFINNEQSNSNFKAINTEAHFIKDGKFKPIEIEVDNKSYIISGYIDRIDKSDNWFRIIDYKTGKADKSKGKENLFYGRKIQLFIYAKAAEINIDKKLFGVFYLPIKDSSFDLK